MRAIRYLILQDFHRREVWTADHAEAAQALHEGFWIASILCTCAVRVMIPCVNSDFVSNKH